MRAGTWMRVRRIVAVVAFASRPPRSASVAAARVRLNAIEGLRRLNELASGPSQDPRVIPENANESDNDRVAADKSGSDQAF